VIKEREQELLIIHPTEAFVIACPGAGKTRTIVNRVAHISESLPPRKGIGILSFTNSAVDTFIERCRTKNLETILKHPSFIGTFDAFVRQFLIVPSGIDDVDVQPHIVDSWDSLDVEVRLSGTNAFQGAGVSLDRFNPLNNHIDPATIGHSGLRSHVEQNLQAYIQSATQYRAGLRRKGYLSAADARVLAEKKLERSHWAASLGKALKGRFHEIIVDEAQDCNPEDLKILQWLRSHDLRVTLVCDPDQAIYEFRQGSPANLSDFATTYDHNNQLKLTGNFRSSPTICSFAATLRSRTTPDNSIGENTSVTYPVQIICYQGRVTAEIGRQFIEIIERIEPTLEDRMILSHAFRYALQASGNTPPSESGNSNLESMARVVNQFWSPFSSNREKESVLRDTEKIILRLMGKIDRNEHPVRATERHGIEKRELRRKALELITALPPVCSDSDEGKTEWLNRLHVAIQQLSLEFPAGRSEKTFFPRTRKSSWAEHLRRGTFLHCPCKTIHHVKGKEFKAVCVVIPPDRAPDNNTSKLFDVWENRTDEEAKRVIYVGATRAEKLLTIAIPESFRDRLIRILDLSNVSYFLNN